MRSRTERCASFPCSARLRLDTPSAASVGTRCGVKSFWKAWLLANNAAVMAVLFVVLGFVLLEQGISAVRL